ncbi:hypothetical protein Daus18300_012665 [Diaporthe australafricana]|uniref:AAA+ ATPase domain-containing protein n=1 Tax=Diaporthe australafricana TaxID=127596 RepID=A0ABR3W1U2_9PEZI
MALAKGLWDHAFQSLSLELQANLNAMRTHKRDVLDAVLKDAESKRTLSTQKRWKYTKPNGDIIIVRDVLEKIVGWVEKFKDTGDTIVQYDPGHAALPWAAVRFLLKVAVSEIQIFAALVDDLEYIARMMVRYRAFEGLYLRGTQSETEKKLEDALTCLYVEILTHLSIAVKFFQQRTLVRLLKSPFRSVDEERAKAMSAREKEVDAFARLVDADILRSIEAGFTRISTQTSRELSKERYNDVLEWLAVAPYYLHHQFLAQSRLPNAGQWLLSHTEYRNWQASSAPSLLLVDGIPGSGKSTLCSVVVDFFLKTASNVSSSAPFGYFYYCVRLILELAEENPMTIIIDGLDAVDDTERPVLIEALREIISKADNVVNILVTTRNSSRAAAIPAAEFHIQITSQENQGDMVVLIDHLVESAVTRAGEMFLWARLQTDRICRETVESDVITALRCNLPEEIDQLYRQNLNRILDSGDVAREIASKLLSWLLFMREPLTPRALLGALAAGKDPTLDLTQAMATCSNFIILDTKCNVIRFAHQSVQDFLSRHHAFAPAKSHRLLATCCMEACLRGPSTIFDQHLKIPSDDFYVYAAMYWPTHTEISQRLHDSTPETKALIRVVTLFIFDEQWDQTLAFDSWVNNGRALVQILRRDHVMKPTLDAIPETDSSFLFVLSMFGLCDILVPALSNIVGLDLNQRNELGHTPVYLAAAFGHPRTVESLVEHGANINVECGKHGSPLHVACFQGHLEVVRTLLHLGAQARCGSVYKSALEAALRGGKEDAALYLVDLTQNVDTEDDYEKALGQAALQGFIKVTHKLQSSRFSSSTKETDRMRQKIWKTIQGGQVGVLRQFLDRDATNSEYLPSDAIALATLHNDKNMVSFLLDQGMDLEVVGDFGSPLRTAALLNFQSIVRLLVARGARINASESFGAALQAAALNGHTSLARFLIQEGAEVNQRSGFYGSALQAAAYHGHLDTVEMLIDSNANVDSDGYSRSALHAAAEGGHEDVIMLILRKTKRLDSCVAQVVAKTAGSYSPFKGLLRDASPGRTRSRDAEGWQVQDGAHSAKESMIDMESISRASDSEITSDQTREDDSAFDSRNDRWENSSPLVAAASSGQEKTVDWLLRQEQGPLFASDDQIKSAVSAASEQRHLSVVYILLGFVAKRPKTDDRTDRSASSIALDVDTALKLASKYFTASENSALSNKFSTTVRKYYHTDVCKEELLQDLEFSCKTGDIPLATAILETEHQILLSTDEVTAALQICGWRGQITVARLLLESSILRDRKPLSGENAFVSAAEGGFVDSMKLFVSHWPQLSTTQEATSRALVESSTHGHIDAIKYLVLELKADVNTPSPGRHFNRRLQSMGMMPSVLDHMSDFDPYVRFDPTLGKDLTLDKSGVWGGISPLQAGLHCFAHRLHPYSGSHFGYAGSRETNQSQQEDTISFLLENGAAPDDPGGQRAVPVLVAAKLCSPRILQMLISAGADVNATWLGKPAQGSLETQNISTGTSRRLESYSTRSAVFEASGRELCGLPILSRLVASGAAIPEDVDEQNRVLSQALEFFEVSKYGASDDRFEYSSSLVEVFTEGPGSVLFFLLSRMPRVKATDTRWSLVLQMAAFLDQTSFVDLLLSRGVDVNSEGHYYGTALQAAARCGHTAMTQKLLDAGAKVNVTGGEWQTALRAAIVDGHGAIVHLLLDHGADLRFDNTIYQADASEKLMSPLQLAVQSGRIDIVKRILAKDADPALSVSEGTCNPLIIAASNGVVEIVKVLLNAGASVNVHGKPPYPDLPAFAEEASPIHAAIFAGHLDILDLLLSSGADIECDVDGSGTPLAAAATTGNIQVVRRLISAGAKTDDSTALAKAVLNNHIEAAKVLIASGAKPKGAVSLACSFGDLDIIELLIEKSLDIDEPEAVFNEVLEAYPLTDSVYELLLEYAMSTMHQFLLACAAASPASVELLLKQGMFDVNEADQYSGDYPLQIAALHLRPTAVRTLVSHGANIDCESLSHGTPLNTALKARAAQILKTMEGESIRRIVSELSLPETHKKREMDGDLFWEPDQPEPDSDCESIVMHLIAHGADTSQVEPALGPPLHLACLLGYKAVVESLLSREQTLSLTLGHFEKPLFAAIQGRNSHITSILLQHEPPLDYVHAEYGTALHHACTVQDGASVELLLQHGANATLRDMRGRTPLTVALQIELERQAPESREHAPLSVEISDDDLVAAASLSRIYSRNQLLCLDRSRLTPQDQPVADALEMMLDEDPSTTVSPEIFLHIFHTGTSAALHLLNLLERHEKRIFFTGSIQVAIGDAYKLESQQIIRERFYHLQAESENENDPWTSLLPVGLEFYSLYATMTPFQLVMNSKKQPAISLCNGLESCSEHQIQRAANEDHVVKILVAVKALCEVCKSDGDELLRIIKKLRTKPDAKGKWDSFRVALKKAWEKTSIDELEARLSRTQVTLTLHICTLTHYCNRGQSNRLQHLQDQSLLLQSNQADALRRISNGIDDLQKRVREGREAANAQLLTGFFSMDDVHRLQEKMQSLSLSEQHVAKQQVMLESLTFDSRPVRHAQIVTAHEKTFQWALKTGLDQSRGPGIGDWLRNGKGVFWVSGKPGSGKSTLMKYITDSAITSKLVDEWAQPGKAVVASHFFWIAGTSMQKSQQGLLQTLLYDIFRKRPYLIDQICGKRLASSQPGRPWSLAELHGTLQTVATMAHDRLKFCFIIDGMDEYSGDHEDRIQLCKTFKDLARSKNIKLLLSSRSWNVFEEEFGIGFPKIYMQDLTRDDIESFVTARLEEHARWAVISANHSQGQWLISEIAAKSNGVFLWVFLVTKLLREGLTNRDAFVDLRRRLQSFPSELDSFFMNILEGVEPFYHSHMSTALQLASASTKSQMSFLVYSFHFQEYEDPEYAIKHAIRFMDNDEIQEMKDTTSWRLDSRTRGLLEVNPDGNVTFLHRTVRDFLNTQEMHNFLVAKTDPHLNFRPSLSILKAYIALIKTSSVPDRVTRISFGKFKSAHSSSKSQHVMTDLLERALQYAGELESHISHDLRHHPLLDELDRSLLCLVSGDTCKFVPGPRSFLKQAVLREQLVQFRLFDYLNSKLDSEPDFLKNIGSLPVMHLLSPDPTNGAPLQRGQGIGVLVSLLETRGMDPNKKEEFTGPSPWKELLKHICHSWFSNKKNGIRNLSFLLEERILRLFLKAGADVNLHIRSLFGTWRSMPASVVYMQFCFDVFDQSPPLQALYLDILSEFLRLSHSGTLEEVCNEFGAVLSNDLHWNLAFFSKVKSAIMLSLDSHGPEAAQARQSLDEVATRVFPLELYTPLEVATTSSRKGKRKRTTGSGARKRKNQQQR